MIYLITNRHLAGVEAFEEVVVEAIDAGVHGVILREKDLPKAMCLRYGKAFKKRMRSGQKLIMHSHVDVALEASADGVHFSFADFIALDEKSIRQLSGESELLLGVSVHSVEEAVKAAVHGASYLLAGHVFDTSCKVGLPGRGLDFIASVCGAVDIPVIALGGISPQNAHLVVSAGATGVAVMSGIMAAESSGCAVVSYFREGMTPV